MRLLSSVFLLFGALVAIRYDVVAPSPGSIPCRVGLCRFDQMFGDDLVVASDKPLVQLKTALHLDPANPYRWLELGEHMAMRGNAQAASPAFERAVTLGPHLPLVLMRAANYYFSNGRSDQGVPLAGQVLSLTPQFDEIIFAQLAGTVTEPSALLGGVIPSDRRVVGSFLMWLERRGQPDVVEKAWRWGNARGLMNEDTTSAVAQYLWSNKRYAALLEMTATQRNRINNSRFSAEPRRLPVDWTIGPQGAVEVLRDNGLNVEFMGTANVAWCGVWQSVVVTPGLHTLRVDWSGDGLTTNEGPYVRVADAESAARLDVRTDKFTGSFQRRTIRLPFVVTPATQVIAVQLRRDASQKLDNKISGRLHVYEVALD